MLRNNWNDTFHEMISELQKVDLGWNITDTMQWFSWESVTRIVSFHQVSQLQKGKDHETTVQGNLDIVVDTIFEDKYSLKGKEM